MCDTSELIDMRMRAQALVNDFDRILAERGIFWQDAIQEFISVNEFDRIIAEARETLSAIKT